MEPEIQQETQETEIKDITSLPSDQLETYLNEGTPEQDNEAVSEPEKEGDEQHQAKEQTGEEKSQEEQPPKETELEKLTRQLKDKELFITRQANEIGELRKHRQALDAVRQALPQNEQEYLDALNELAIQNPVEFQRQYATFQRNKQEEKRLIEEMELNHRASVTKGAVDVVVPDFEQNIKDIASVLEMDGIPQDSIKEFISRPYVNDAGLLINLAKRASMHNENLTLKQQIEDLKKENEALRKKPDEVLRKIENATKSRPMTGATGGANGINVPSGTKPIHSMSTEELNKFMSG